MPTGQTASAGPSFIALAASAGGPVGALGLLIAGLGELGFLPGVNPHGWAFVGASLFALSSWWRGWRTERMIAKNAAKMTIENPAYTLQSPDPAINREIQKQLSDVKP